MRQAAHDLANLLTVSNGHRQEAQKHLEKALKADKLMMELVRRVLAGNLAGPAGVFDINAVAGELVGAMEALGGSVSMDLQCSPGPVLVAGDALTMHRALFNLCINARNAGASLIVVKTLRSGEKAVVSIEDNGCGFPPAMIENIWKQPVSADGQHGHGLAIVRKTIKQHAGNVVVRSGSSGTKFEIALPIAALVLGTAVA